MAGESGDFRGRGTASNPGNRFERLDYVLDDEADPSLRPAPATVFFRDASRSALSENDSPDIPFTYGLNPYRGCEHGCIYCYARPFHEYLGFSAGLDFETRIMVKEDLPGLLRQALSRKTWEPQVVAVSGVTDAYQPIERKLCLTRRCLEVFRDFRNPVAVITKNHLVARDADVLGELASFEAACATLSITTLEPELARVMEPRASTPQKRLEAVAALAKAGVPVSVNVAPVIPGLNDHEVPAIVVAAAAAGAKSAAWQLVRLPHGVAALFEAWLARHFPDRKEKVLSQLRALRGGELNAARFGERMRGKGAIADNIDALFNLARRKAGLGRRSFSLSSDSFRIPPGPQLSLF